MKALLFVVALAALAEAKPTDDAKATYTAQLAAGHAAQHAQKWDDAVAAFTKALAAVPDDPTALTELGWTQYLRGDLAAALAATQKAVRSDGAPEVRGAALYNLGLIAEKQGDKARAIAAYTESLKVRPHSVVRAALAKLDAKAAAASDPFAAVAMVKIKSIDAFCAAQPSQPELGEDGCTCGEEAIAGIDAFEITRRCHTGGGQPATEQHWLAWKTDSTWYATATPIAEPTVSRRCGYQAALTGVEQGKRQVITLAAEGTCGDGFNDDSWTERALIVVGKRGKAPVATPPIVIARREVLTREQKEQPPVVDFSLAATWRANGSLELSGKTKGLDPSAAHDLVGPHALSIVR